MLMNEEIYTALLDAGANEEKARAAARSVAQFDQRLQDMSSDLTRLKWIGGFNLTLTVGVLWKLFAGGH